MPWIKNLSRFAPFSDKMGVHVWIPYTKVIAQIFPTRLVLGTEVIELPLQGPIDNFTVFAEWEKGRVQWYGKSPQGHFQGYIYAREGKLIVQFQDTMWTFPTETSERPPVERLSFGCTKKQRVEDVVRRKNVAEFLPLCFFLSQMVPPGEHTQHILNFTHIFSRNFYDLFVPTLEDRFHQKITDTVGGDSPWDFLARLYVLIKRCFVQEKEKQIHILPQLPQGIAAGRLTNFQLETMQLDLEWRKKDIRRMCIEAKKGGDVHFQFPKEIKSYRLRKNLREKGERRPVNHPLLLEENQIYYFDRFTK